jgi:TPR repeat protein
MVKFEELLAFCKKNDASALLNGEFTLAQAQCNLGLCYENGTGIAADAHAAVKWYMLSAEAGYKTAQYNLALCFANGTGVAADAREAVKWYTRAAEAGFAKAQGNLAVCYATGEGVKQDFKEAVKWFTRAAEAGDIISQFNLGLYYFEAKGIAQDYVEAFKWFTRAAEAGHAGAQNNLGHFYEKGMGVEQDFKKAVDWYSCSAKAGDLQAQSNMGKYYAKGLILKQDLKEAANISKQLHAKGFDNSELGKVIKEQKQILEDQEKVLEDKRKDKMLADIARKKDDAQKAKEAKLEVKSKPKVPKNEIIVPPSVAFSAPAVDAAVGKVPKGKRKADVLSPEAKTANVLENIADRKAAAAAAKKAKLDKSPPQPVLVAHFPERTADHYHEEDLLKKVCVCAIHDTPPSLEAVHYLLKDLGFDKTESHDGHEFWSKNLGHPTMALPVFNDTNGGRIKFSKSEKASGMYPEHYGAAWKLLGLIGFDGKAMRCRVCEE